MSFQQCNSTSAISSHEDNHPAKAHRDCQPSLRFRLQGPVGPCRRADEPSGWEPRSVPCLGPRGQAYIVPCMAYLARVTFVLFGKDPILDSSSSKIEVTQAPGIFTYLDISGPLTPIETIPIVCKRFQSHAVSGCIAVPYASSAEVKSTVFFFLRPAFPIDAW